MTHTPSVAVVGAGALGGWTALELRRAGARVTLLDAWGPGHPRSSSGGASRVIRCGYGPAEDDARSARRAWRRWCEEERRLGGGLLQRCGVLWLLIEEDAYTAALPEVLARQEIPCEALTQEETGLRWPQVATRGVRRALFEPEAGYLHSAEACARVVAAFLAEGGEYLRADVRPGDTGRNGLAALALGDGGRLAADRFVFACGPWLPALFPEILAKRLMPTRQEVFVFGTPAGDLRWEEPALPVWVEYGPLFWYGVPARDGRGFKVADDTRGPVFDPTAGDRRPSEAGAAAAARTLSRRFPALDGAPLVDARVCQYADTPDHRIFVERHPDWGNTWLVGGGSGHAFKHGPVVGARAARAVLGTA